LESCQHRFLTPREQGKTFRPPGCDVGERKARTGSLPRCLSHTGPQIRLEKARSGLIPLLERADGDLLLEQRSCSRGGEAMLTHFAMRGQQAIGWCCTHAKQVPSALFREVKMLRPQKSLLLR
jgi:hypothetical protein